MNKKLLIFSPGSSSGGGIHTVVSNHILFFQNKNIPFEVVETSGANVYRKILRLFICFFVLIKLFFLKEKVLCLFHVASGNSFYRKYLIIYLSNKILGYEYFIHLHGGMFKEFYSKSNDFSKNKIREAFRNSKGIVVLSQSWKDWMVSTICSENVHVVPNSITVDPKSNLSDLDENVRDIDLLFVGRVEVAKGICELLQVVKQDYFLDKNIVLAGRVFLQPESVFLSENVTLLGQQPSSEIYNLMRKAKVLVLPSHYEAFPLVILEAMYSGAICVCSDVGSIPEIITDNLNGFLFPVKNQEELDKKIRHILDNYSESTFIRDEAFRLVTSKYSLELNMNCLISLYFPSEGSYVSLD